jgi:uncharacterized damage-inducible protein DinB
MHPSVQPLFQIYSLNTGLLHKCVKGFTEEEALSRVDQRANNAVFIGLHMADARFHLVGWLGLEQDNPFGPFAEVRHVDEVEAFPTLAEVMEAWDRVSEDLERHLPTLGPEALEGPAPFDIPLGKGRLLDTLAFMAQHESYHIGQLSILRKQLGFDAMEWS